MVECAHEFGLKTRESGETYCPVCRAHVLLEDLMDEDESIRQGRSDVNKLDGRGPIGDSSGEGFKWRKV